MQMENKLHTISGLHFPVYSINGMELTQKYIWLEKLKIGLFIYIENFKLLNKNSNFGPKKSEIPTDKPLWGYER